jgi:hypothetical protein
MQSLLLALYSGPAGAAKTDHCGEDEPPPDLQKDGKSG